MSTESVRAVLLAWQSGASIRSIARDLELDRKTVRRYLGVAKTMRFERWMRVDDDVVRAIASVFQRRSSRVSETQLELEGQRTFIRNGLAFRIKLAAIHAALVRKGVRVSYASLRRFAIAELAWRPRTRLPLAA